MKLILPYLKHMAQKEGSDMYFTTGAFPSMKMDGKMVPMSKTRLDKGVVEKIAYDSMSDDQIAEFEINMEMNFAAAVEGIGRFRFNVFRQRSEVSIVIRYIKTDVPSFESLGLPKSLGELMMEKKGLILIVGSTGSGKSTSMASMLDYRNANDAGHILTIEDPIEFVFDHKKSIINQREVGLDTMSYENALREALREAPDVIMIGEVRDRETMEAAISYADTGHLCLSTLHAVNANQALDRIINMFPTEGQNQILLDLALNLRGIISQRLVKNKQGGRVAAIEIMINNPFITELIRAGRIHDIKEAMSKSGQGGMQTFDQSLFTLFKQNKIDLNTALDNADSRSDLEWKINFGGASSDLNTAKAKPADTLEFPSEIEHLPD